MLYELFSDSIENFYDYGPTEVRKGQWETLVAKSKENEHWKDVVEELTLWVE